MTAKKTDNRARPKIHRTDDKHDKRLRDWAAKQGLDPWQALEMAIDWLGAPPRTAADLESAREATRRADAEVERLTRELAFTKKQVERRDITAERLTEERDAARAAPQPCALPAELDQRVRDRIAARPGRDLAFIVKNGCDRLEASDGYQDRQKAARKARS